jgi:hypothetical protein
MASKTITTTQQLGGRRKTQTKKGGNVLSYMSLFYIPVAVVGHVLWDITAALRICRAKVFFLVVEYGRTRGGSSKKS